MSRDTMSRGIIIPLRTPLKDPIAMSDRLHDQGSSLQVNEEGTLIYSDEAKGGNDAPGLYFDRPNPTGCLMNELRERELAVTTTQARSYGCLGPNPIDQMTKQQFLDRTNQ
jgi:hypothetical protein